MTCRPCITRNDGLPAVRTEAHTLFHHALCDLVLLFCLLQLCGIFEWSMLPSDFEQVCLFQRFRRHPLLARATTLHAAVQPLGTCEGHFSVHQSAKQTWMPVLSFYPLLNTALSLSTDSNIICTTGANLCRKRRSILKVRHRSSPLHC